MAQAERSSRDRLALLLGLILVLAAAGLVVLAFAQRAKTGTCERLSLNWSSIRFFLVVAGILIAPAGMMLATLGWQKGLIAVNVEAMVLLCAILLGIVSFINNRYYKREDWTKKGRYGLSDQTIQVLKNSLNKKLTITSLVTTDDAELYHHLSQILKEYQFHSGNVEVVFQNPDADMESVTELLKKLDIKNLPALIIQYGDRHEEVNPGSLIEYGGSPYGYGDPMDRTPKFKVEEQVTSAIMKLTDEKQVEVCFTTGHGERDPEDYGDDGLSDLKKQLERANYKIRKIDVAKDQIPDGAVLVVAGPRKAKFQEVETQAVQNFLKDEKGKLFAMVDPRSEAGAESGLASLFQDYDVTLRDDVTVVNMTLDMRTMRPALTLMTRAYCDESAGAGNDIVAKMKGFAFMFPQACAIETKPSNEPGAPPTGGFNATPILRVAETIKVEGDKTATVWGEMSLKQGEALEFNADQGDIGPPVTVGVAVEPKPPTPPAPGMPPPPAAETPGGPRIVLIGDSDFASNKWVKSYSADANLFTNCVAWLAEKKGKLGIPPKEIDFQRLDRDAVSGSRSLSVFLLIVILPTMVGIVLGSFVWVLRRK